MSTMTPLVLKDMPLVGQRLIEASAGTGKTYTISHLLLRLVIAAQPQLGEEPLLVTEILVVTFTRAATQELKDRIRDILHRAKAYLEETHAADDDLKCIVDDALIAADRHTLISRCHRAILMLDDAPVFTIHGFCQRMLSEFSFSTGQAIEQQLIEDESRILLELTEELWRQHCYPLDKRRAMLWKTWLQSPSTLLGKLSPVLDSSIEDPGAVGDPALKLEQLFARIDGHWQQAATLWQAEESTILGFFAKGIGRSHQKRWVGKWFDSLSTYLKDQDRSYLLWDNSIKFCQSYLDEKLAEKAPQHHLFHLLDELQDSLVQIKPVLLGFCRLELISRLTAYQQQKSIVFFNDLVHRLAEATRSGDICQSIRQRYPVALIDEFQDTDQWQYNIFHRVYSKGGTGLLLIGDPKQAIYSFRGADIDAYFKARASIPEANQYTLMTNYRTVPALVRQINHLFAAQSDAFCMPGFPDFVQVNSSAGKSDTDRLDTEHGLSSLTVLARCETEPCNKAEGKLLAAEKTAHWIKRLLTDKAQINKRDIEPNDIAILVRKSSQAALIKQALSAVGINSVYLSRESVLCTEEALAFIDLVQAVIDPYRVGIINKALAGPLITLDANQVYRINQQAQAFDEYQLFFIRARELWQKQGFYSGFESLMHNFSIPEHVLATPDGERRLTNLNQLCDIFGELENPQLSFMDQLHLFQEKCLEAEGGDESQKLRLETEANLVEIVTIHKSKGMEYPLVCCPFVFEGSQGPKRQAYTLFNRQTSCREVYWQLDDVQSEQQAMDELAEDIRLLYVALTRAKCHLCLFWGRIKGIEKSALYHLLYHRTRAVKTLSDTDWWQPFEALDAQILDTVTVSGSDTLSHPCSEELLATAPLLRSLRMDYYARSYSALVKSEHYDLSVLSEDPLLSKDRDQQDNTPLQPTEFDNSIFHFPKGSEAGNFMHQILEDVDFSKADAQLNEIVDLQMDRYHFNKPLWQSVIVGHMHQCLKKTLMPAGCALNDLGTEQVLKEMGFQLQALHHQGSALTALLARYRGKPLDRACHDMQGDFKGFIDLIFCYQGKYYVLDYKSNFLGYQTADYDADNMHRAIEDHTYDLQYLIYLAALQRYLKSRCADYDYDSCMGGVFYLFLRGINREDDAGIYFTRPDAAIINAVESLFCEGEY